METLQIAGVDLNAVDTFVALVEEDHVQVRAPSSMVLTGCSCGVRYDSDDPYGESTVHLRRARTEAVLTALSQACTSCRGSGEWRKFGGTLECPDCDGLGRHLLPLPADHFRDRACTVWRVTRIKTDGDSGRAWIERGG